MFAQALSVSVVSFVSLGLAASASLPVAAQATAPDPHAHHQHHQQQSTQAVTPQNVRVKLADVSLLDQQGRSVLFRSDVVGERLVIIDFVYTSCTTVCPVVSATLAQVQGQLGERVGRDVALLSVTVDPVRDTPARLKEYASRIGAGPGWTWLTGPKPQIDEVLKSFGAYTPSFVDHPALVMVGDAKSGRWLRFYGFPSAEQLVTALAELGAARAKADRAG